MQINWDYDTQFGKFVAGADEVGRGSLIGPVYAAAIIIPPELQQDSGTLPKLKDSKKLSASQRLAIYQALKDRIQYAVASASLAEITQHNILQASLIAMHRAIHQLAKPIDYVLIDGNQFPPNLGLPGKTLIKGDNISPSLALAGIIAKIKRDEYITEIAQQYPEYQWHKNFGYATLAHQQAIQTYGLTPHHRPSFKLKCLKPPLQE